ncbi:TetR/AcrR family transcriptional regulator [Tenggerimyces flavus]|uniref:TetR/AcrR family transcriptional regulator n=1 Tax=Tenggerimyces flavus TaxID=1708749 RepID=A0ABV7YH15_9ACTN|nr:TetR/AcrR family transcriptional regulator [Tenggerimyces flavus]MBM7784713.1 AcrR family transcriptional regulator [Tenggerimyces flavus]
MSPRKYEQRTRAATAEETRQRVLEAMYERLRAAPAAAVSVDQVARDAGVARSTIYLVFESRAGLFDALAVYVFERSGFRAISDAVHDPDAREHLRGSFRAGSKAYAAERDVLRALYSGAHLDPEAFAGAVQRLEDGRLGGMRYLAKRLQEQGCLRAEVTQREAVDQLFVLTSFDAFDLLHTSRGLSVAKTASTLSDLAERALCVVTAGRTVPR